MGGVDARMNRLLIFAAVCAADGILAAEAARGFDDDLAQAGPIRLSLLGG